LELSNLRVKGGRVKRAKRLFGVRRQTGQKGVGCEASVVNHAASDQGRPVGVWHCSQCGEVHWRRTKRTYGERDDRPVVGGVKGRSVFLRGWGGKTYGNGKRLKHDIEKIVINFTRVAGREVENRTGRRAMSQAGGRELLVRS